jgi:hypothetical protein
VSPSHVRIELVRPARLDVAANVSQTDAMDPLIVALAQLVRDRWTREQGDRAAARERLRVGRRMDR